VIHEISGLKEIASRQVAADSEQQAVSLSVISYLLFGRSVTMSCLDDLNDFYDFYGFNDLLLTAYRLPKAMHLALCDHNENPRH
jgi:hypothetical protein